MASSQNGWPASDEPRTIGVESYQIPGTTIKIRCSKKVAPLLINFCAEFHQSIEPIGKNTWGYAYRAIRGQEEAGNLSNHSSATAVDINSERHQLRLKDTFPEDKREPIRLLAKKYGLRWGGDYKNRKDEMHFEIVLSPKEVKEKINELGLADWKGYKPNEKTH